VMELDMKRFIEISEMEKREQSILKPRWWMRRRQRGRKVHLK